MTKQPEQLRLEDAVENLRDVLIPICEFRGMKDEAAALRRVLDELKQPKDSDGAAGAPAPPEAEFTLGPTAEKLAQRFHETYERLAPDFGYRTREASAKPWSEVPDKNKSLMIAVCAEILATPAPAKTAHEGEESAGTHHRKVLENLKGSADCLSSIVLDDSDAAALTYALAQPWFTREELEALEACILWARDSADPDETPMPVHLSRALDKLKTAALQEVE